MSLLRRSTLLRTLLASVVGVVLVVVVSGWIPDLQNFNLATVGAYVCATAGLTVLTGTNGQVSLGHAAFMAIGGYTVALLDERFDDHNITALWTIPVSLLAGAALTAVAGAVIGVAAARLYGPYLAGATLALGVALPDIASHYSGVFHGDQGLSVPYPGPPSGLGDNFSSDRWLAWISVFSAIVVLFLLANLGRSAIGRHLRAVRDDEIAAQLSGLSVGRIRVLAFAISAFTAGLGGGVLALTLQIANPGSFSLTLSLSLLSAIVIGGLGSLFGAVWGSLIIVYLGILLQDFTDRLHLSAALSDKLKGNLPLAVYGLLLILFMLLLPGGIQDLLRRLGALVRRRPAPPAAGAAADSSVVSNVASPTGGQG